MEKARWRKHRFNLSKEMKNFGRKLFRVGFDDKNKYSWLLRTHYFERNTLKVKMAFLRLVHQK